MSRMCVDLSQGCWPCIISKIMTVVLTVLHDVSSWCVSVTFLSHSIRLKLSSLISPAGRQWRPGKTDTEIEPQWSKATKKVAPSLIQEILCPGTCPNSKGSNAPSQHQERSWIQQRGLSFALQVSSLLVRVNDGVGRWIDTEIFKFGVIVVLSFWRKSTLIPTGNLMYVCCSPAVEVLTLLHWCQSVLKVCSVYPDITVRCGHMCSRAHLCWVWSEGQETWDFASLKMDKGNCDECYKLEEEGNIMDFLYVLYCHFSTFTMHQWLLYSLTLLKKQPTINKQERILSIILTF